MRQRTLPHWPLAGLSCLAFALLLLPLPACLTPDSVTCASGMMCPVGHSCSADQNTCIMNGCGDGIAQAGEVCDDGNVRDGDGCSADCKSIERCGDHVVNMALGEACDDGNTTDHDGCSADCRSNEFCGNGITDLAIGEKCDDGNRESGDGCSKDCLSNEKCGNNIVDDNELCDDGNNLDGDGCSASCQSLEGCGNNIVDPGEQCDDGNADTTDACVKCQWAQCGDGYVQSGKEQCDDKGESAACNANCTKNLCGDGIVNVTAKEECDAGNRDSTGTLDTNSCTKTCKISRCGDGYTNEAAGEVCDDRNANVCGTCNESCSVGQKPARASGGIMALSSNELKEGDILSISDGETRLFFEFTKGDERSGYTKIGIDSHWNGDVRTDIEMAERIMIAINNSSLKITASQKVDEPYYVLLSNNKSGSRVKTNEPIFESVQNKAFIVTGMQGGVDACPKDVGCHDASDCASNRCVSGQCQ